MTVVVAWVRTLSNGTEELVIAADSRLTGGGNLDCAPKILVLPRSDAVIAFAGSTYFAYPLMLQLSQAIRAYSPLRDRAMDYHKMRAHALSIFDSMVGSFAGIAKNLEVQETAFILAGYSWVQKAFAIDVIGWRAGEQRFSHTPCPIGIGNFGKIKFAGDRGGDAFHALTDTLKTQYGVLAVDARSTITKRFDMEPFVVLRDMLRSSSSHDSIGGPPQMVRVTQYMNVSNTAVYWPTRSSGQVYLGGRPLMSYENVDHWILDPDTFEMSHPRFAPSYLLAEGESEFELRKEK
jgi:hypothetical protein